MAAGRDACAMIWPLNWWTRWTHLAFTGIPVFLRKVFFG